MNKNSADENIGGPAVDRTDQPAELDLAHDKMNAFVGRIYRRRVVKQEENAGYDLKDKEEQAYPSKIIPDGMFMLRDRLFFGKLKDA
jgi:hypothetical protein